MADDDLSAFEAAAHAADLSPILKPAMALAARILRLAALAEAARPDDRGGGPV
jgi:hypothetical protein